MLKSLSIAGVFALALVASADPSVAYVSEDSAGGPWGGNYRSDFDAVFGATGWRESTFDAGDSSLFDNAQTSLLVLEGSDWMANGLNAFLAANDAALTSFVNNGGSLIVNSAPNEGSGSSFLGGAFQINYPNIFDYTAVAVNPGHPVASGPFGSFTSPNGSSASHGYVSGTGLSAILVGESGFSTLGEASFGEGRVIVGSLTTALYPLYEDQWTGGWQTFNQNLLAYGNNQAVPEPASMAALGFGALALLRRRRAAK